VGLVLVVEPELALVLVLELVLAPEPELALVPALASHRQLTAKRGEQSPAL